MTGFNYGRVMTQRGFQNVNIHVKEGKITAVSEHVVFDGVSFDENVFIVPGFIDQHIHGVCGADVMDASALALATMAKSLPKEGTTSFCPTTMTSSEEAIVSALSAVAHAMTNQRPSDGAEMLGVHLEGPFINENVCGAQPKEHVQVPSVKTYQIYEKASQHKIKLVTLAPEVKGATDLMDYLKAQGVVISLGHSAATYDDAVKAISHGATAVTHCYNAMSPLHHRDAGLVGAAMLHDVLQAELILDGIHVSAPAAKLLHRYKKTKGITLVTDAMRAKGLTDGNYDLGGQAVMVKGVEARLKNGTIAGSVMPMKIGIKNAIAMLEVSLEEAVKMASENPAKKCGVFDRKGSIEVGKDADFVVLNQQLDVIMTVCRGHITYQKES